jgi:hypothetical protein
VIGFSQTSDDGDYYLANRNIATSAGWVGVLVHELRFGSYMLWNASNQMSGAAWCNISFPKDIKFDGSQTIQRAFINTVVFPRNSAITFNQTNSVSINHLVFPKAVTIFGLSTYAFYQAALNRIVVPEYTDTTAKNANVFNYFTASIISLPSSFSFANAATFSSATLTYIDIVQGWTPNKNLTINQSYLWSADSLVKFFTKLGTTSTAITLTFGASNLNKLTAAQKAIATDKGYTLA